MESCGGGILNLCLEPSVKEAREAHRLCGQKVRTRPDPGQDRIESEPSRAHGGIEKGTILRHLGGRADRQVKDGMAAFGQRFQCLA